MHSIGCSNRAIARELNCSPSTSCEKGSVEGCTGTFRCYIPKGDCMDKCSAEAIAKIEVWCNSLPLKILNYKTPEECFDVELDHIYRRR